MLELISGLFQIVISGAGLVLAIIGIAAALVLLIICGLWVVGIVVIFIVFAAFLAIP